MSNAMELLKPTPEEEARGFCIHAGWHYNGDTSAMLGNGGAVQLPEVMVAYTRQIIAERDRLLELLKDALNVQIKPMVVVGAASPAEGPTPRKFVSLLWKTASQWDLDEVSDREQLIAMLEAQFFTPSAGEPQP